MTETMPTLKAIHICNSHKPTHRQKLQKSMSLPTLTDKQDGKDLLSYIFTCTQAGVRGCGGQESAKFEVQFFVGSSVVKIPACV